MPRLSIEERDESGRLTAAYSITAGKRELEGDADLQSNVTVEKRRTDWRRLLSNVFLPAGYPASVSPDYLQYQIYNALQAFCSSLAGLIASRAVLQGHGVGNADASATHAIFLTVLQDIFSRLTTIVAGYHLGTSLFPEAKTYRFLADIFNDAAIVLDTLSPHMGSLRVASLCLSGACRALCGVAAGGSKTALTVHFATSERGAGDVGDLNAKDGSKETILALLGMLSGTVVMHYVHSTRSTYVVLFALIFLHLLTNYLAVCAVVLRSLNRQRANILWTAYRAKSSGPAGVSMMSMLTPEAVAAQERIFVDPSAIYDTSAPSSPQLATCLLGSPFSTISSRSAPSPPTSLGPLSSSQIQALVELFSDEKYLLWFDPSPRHACYMHVCLKDGHTPADDLKAWAHAQETAFLLDRRAPRSFDVAIASVQTAHALVQDLFPSFVDAARTAGWRIEEGGLLSGSPRTIRIESVDESEDAVSRGDEDRKKV